MLKTALAIITFLSLSFSSSAQLDLENYLGLWKGKTVTENPFRIKVAVKEINSTHASLILSNDKKLFEKKFSLEDELRVSITSSIFFEGIFTEEKATIHGFIKFGPNFYPITLSKKGSEYRGLWNLESNYHLHPESMYMKMRKVYDADNKVSIYPLLDSYWVDKLKIKDDKISFIDNLTTLTYQGVLKPSEIAMSVCLENVELGQIIYNKVDKVEGLKSLETNAWENSRAPLKLNHLNEDIVNNVLTGVESILVAQGGKIRYENYFNGANASTLNRFGSVGKSMCSALIGIAIDEGIVASTNETLYDFLPSTFLHTKDQEKLKITLEDLLTMSSGIGVQEDWYKQSDNWVQEILKPKLKYPAGKATYYKSADPLLLNVLLKERLSFPLEMYMQQKIFSPLGIENYMLNTGENGKYQLTDGIHMKPQDMLKFGQLYLNKGIWNGKRIISEKWVNTSFEKHVKLENTRKKNHYGYLWWHHTYSLDNKLIEAIEARGSSGQFISIIPELETVIVVTTENYNNSPSPSQTEYIIEKYILTELDNK